MLYFSMGIIVFAFVRLVHSEGPTISTSPSNSSLVATCSKESDKCKDKIRGSVCLLPKGLCICKVGFRQDTVNDVCNQIVCYSNSDCDQHRYQQDSRDTVFSDSVCDNIHHRCTCLQGYYETADGLCAFGSTFDWTIIAINAGLCLAFSTLVVLIFCLCLWCVFDEPLSKCRKCTSGGKGRRLLHKSEDGPTLKGMMSAKSTGYSAPTLKFKMKQKSSLVKKSRSKTTQSMKKNKPKYLVEQKSALV